MSGHGRTGRWWPLESTGQLLVLYTGLDVEKVDREFIRSMRRAWLPLEKLPARRLARITVQLSRVLDLSYAAVLATQHGWTPAG